MSLSGHLWTVGGLLRRTVSVARAPSSEPWATTLEDPQTGTIRLSGRLAQPPRSRGLVVLVHGLGGSAEGAYMKAAAQSALALGLASLRLNLRGADGESGDIHHGGLCDDLAAASRNLARRFDRIYILGFSLGGHVALRFAAEVDEPAVAAIAAVCAPLDLAAGADAMDRPMMAPYRAYVLRHLKASYRRTARFGKVPTPPEEVSFVGTLRHWDALTVVPRFGFRDADDYYAQASVGPLLDRLRRPALLVATAGDPMVPPGAIRPYLAGSRVLPEERIQAGEAKPDSGLVVRWLHRGGHLSFPSLSDLGLISTRRDQNSTDYVSQILRWLEQVR